MTAKRLLRVGLVAAFALTALALYWQGYWNYPVLPGKSAQFPLGWWGWWDQGQYIKSARALYGFDFTPASHHYPAGYPLMGALFVGLLPNHPFLIPNLLFYAMICAGFVLVARRFVSLAEALVLGFAGIVCQVHVIENLIVPWTSIPRSAALYALMALAIWRPTDRRYPLWAGLGLGLIYMVRPGDLLFAAPLAVVGLATAVRERRWVGFAARFAAGFVPFCALFHGFNFFVFGRAMPQAYATASLDRIGFSLRFLPLKTFSLFLNPQLLFAEPQSLLSAFPYLMLALPGAAVFVKRLRGTGGALMASQVLCLGYYLAFSDFGPHNVFLYHAIHYLAWLLPLGLFYAYLSFRSAWRELGVPWTAGLFAASAILLMVPDVTVRAVEGAGESVGRAACPPAEAASCDLPFACPPEAFDVAFFRDLGLDGGEIEEVRVDGRMLRHRRDYKVVEEPTRAGVSVIFYRNQRAGRLTLAVRGARAATVGTAGARFYRTGWGLGWRNPLRLARRAGAEGHYAIGLEREMVTRVDVVTQSADDPRLRRAYEMWVPGDFSVEAMVRAEGVQAASATIVGDYPGTSGHAGFALQQVQGRTNHFAFVFGDGKSWMQVGDAGLEAGRRHYLAMSKGGRGVRVWLDGRAIAQRELEEEMAGSEFPVRMGDWLYGGRAFAGRIEQVRVQPGVLSDADVAGRMADLKIH